jgi:hypothetical protein
MNNNEAAATVRRILRNIRISNDAGHREMLAVKWVRETFSASLPNAISFVREAAQK